MYLTKEEWLASLNKPLSGRDRALLEAAYDVLQKNTICKPDVPWGPAPVISP